MVSFIWIPVSYLAVFVLYIDDGTLYSILLKYFVVQSSYGYYFEMQK